MSVYERASFEAFVRSHPGGAVVEQWESIVGKVGDKVFALLSANCSTICFKVDELSFDGLCALRGVKQAPYFAKRQWVQVHHGSDLPEAELELYLKRARELISAKLTKKLRTELGIPR